MDATYAYYLSATFIPPGKPDAFAYFGMQPTAYLGLHLEGNAVFQMKSQRNRIIDALTYPGLAVKGIAAVGPTLDVYGQIKGKITLHGEADAGATLSFGKAEVYWPQNDDSKAEYEKLLGLESDTRSPAPYSVEPVLRAGVAVDAQLDIIVTPEANVGIKIGGGKLVGAATLMDAQLTGYVEGDLLFKAHADYNTDDNQINYLFGAYLKYNLGYKATAQILNFIDSALSPRKAYPSPRSIEYRGKRHFVARLGSLMRRADPMDVDPPQFTKKLSCPKGSSGNVQMLELRISCAKLQDISEKHVTDGTSVRVTGLTGQKNDTTTSVLVEQLMGQMQSNWKRLEPEPDTKNPQGDYWVPWSASAWVSPGEHGPKGSKYLQREKEYPTKQPPPDGMPTRKNDRMSWVFKRDYVTSWLSQGSYSSSDWWDATSWNYANRAKYGPNSGGADSVICAVKQFRPERRMQVPEGEDRFEGYGNGVEWLLLHPSIECEKTMISLSEEATLRAEWNSQPQVHQGGTIKREWIITNVTSFDIWLDELAEVYGARN
ncbi:uncharacterized protein BDV17DRAFT_296638 [Aspergillus undulatus]|uniref:uncharacterized protein n=1 Tax=Aspergillus undulatus TaxID=1810928 RepID=UPI003CCD685B